VTCTSDSWFGLRLSPGWLMALREKSVLLRGREESIKRALQRRVGLRTSIGPWVGIKSKYKGK
jgi:hypothetical protein